jgi:hypothetical protein
MIALPEVGSARCTTDRSVIYERSELERIRWDPKDGELCLSRAKSGETLMEARRYSNVQIDVQTWV